MSTHEPWLDVNADGKPLWPATAALAALPAPSERQLSNSEVWARWQRIYRHQENDDLFEPEHEPESRPRGLSNNWSPMNAMFDLSVNLAIERVRSWSNSTREWRRRYVLRALMDGDGAAGLGAITTCSPAQSGRVAAAFSLLSEALSLAAFQPGGITWGGMHWEAT